MQFNGSGDYFTLLRGRQQLVLLEPLRISKPHALANNCTNEAYNCVHVHSGGFSPPVRTNAIRQRP